MATIWTTSNLGLGLAKDSDWSVLIQKNHPVGVIVLFFSGFFQALWLYSKQSWIRLVFLSHVSVCSFPSSLADGQCVCVCVFQGWCVCVTMPPPPTGRSRRLVCSRWPPSSCGAWTTAWGSPACGASSTPPAPFTPRRTRRSWLLVCSRTPASGSRRAAVFTSSRTSRPAHVFLVCVTSGNSWFKT